MRYRDESTEVIRHFNRYYVSIMRLFDKGYLGTGMSKTWLCLFGKAGRRWCELDFIFTNSSHKLVIHIYESHGFKHIQTSDFKGYSRGDYALEKIISGERTSHGLA